MCSRQESPKILCLCMLQLRQVMKKALQRCLEGQIGVTPWRVSVATLECRDALEEKGVPLLP